MNLAEYSLFREREGIERGGVKLLKKTIWNLVFQNNFISYKAYYFLWDRIIPKRIGSLTVAKLSFSNRSPFTSGGPILATMLTSVASTSSSRNLSKINKN